ncbi:MAG: amino acid ABC transporter substrate-binding protein [Oscillospiraceae bacterium]|nr:amino acid ABC transporter substrate-binding protein [Oscillospiraceae bacterium]
MTKKLTALVLALLIAALGLGLSACDNNGKDATTAAPGATTTEKIFEDDGKLTVGFDASFPPMGFSDGEGGYTGFDLECAAAVAEYLDMELVLKPIIWDNNETELNGGNVDCLWNGMTINEKRLAAFEVSKAYMKNKQVVVVRAADDYETLADLAGKTAGLQNGSTAYQALEANTDFKDSLKSDLVLKENNTLVATDLQSGVIDCAIMDLIVADHMISEGKAFKVLDESLEDEEYGIGFAKGNTALRDKVQNALYALYADGTLKTISQKWFARDVFINMPAAGTSTTTTSATPS